MELLVKILTHLGRGNTKFHQIRYLRNLLMPIIIRKFSNTSSNHDSKGLGEGHLAVYLPLLGH